MNSPLSFAHIATSALIAAWGLTGVMAQNPCDSINEVGFTYADNGAYNYTFAPITPSTGTTIQSMEWGFLGEDLMNFSFAPQPQFTFPGMGDYMVCLRTTVINDQTGMCGSTRCELVSIPVDPDCADVTAAFTISLVNGVLQYNDASLSELPFSGHFWDFGDGASSTEIAPSHVYAGNGPYEACLTVTTPLCSATVCNWIYLGPPDVPCGTLLQPAIGVIQYEKTIAVFDQSITSGMDYAITWDFGDGNVATGSPAIHTYADEGVYEVCGELDLWGPLTADTCFGSDCQQVYTYAAVGINANNDLEPLCAFPVPFTDQLTVEGVEMASEWALVDVLGRIHLHGIASSSAPLVLPTRELEAGNYVLRFRSSHTVKALHVVKGSSK